MRPRAAFLCFWPSMLLNLSLGGCGFGLFIQNDPMRAPLSGIEPGTHARADVLSLLGEPAVSFTERGVDLFERAGELTDVLLPGIPYTTERTYYTLISYDRHGTLTGIDSGGYVYRSTLTAGRFRYHMGYPGTLLEQEESPAYLARSEACAIVLLVAGSRWSDKLYYRDPIHVNDLVWQGPPDYQSYYHLVTEPGGQRVEVTWSRRTGPTTEERSFQCGSGEVLYLTLDSGSPNSTIDIRVDVPADLPDRALILYPPPTKQD